MTKTTSHDQSIQEDYIDIDPNYMFTRSNAPSRRNSREFEFKLCANPQERCSDNSPADELFYKGILLPLHLHPRIQIIQQLLLHEKNPRYSVREEDELKKETMNTYYYASEGCEDSIMPEECGTKNSWSKKFRGLGSSSLCSKLKSLFAKPTFSSDWCQVSKSKDYANNFMKRGRKSIVGRDPSSLKSSTEREKLTEEDELVHRKSFSSAVKLGAITRLNSLYTNSSPSSSSFSSSNSSCPRPNSNEFYISSMQPPAMRRSNSVNSEMESSIQGAITYCKKSQNIVSGRKSVSNIGSYF